MKKKRILYVCGERAFHICSIKELHDGSILIVPSSRIKVVKKAGIEIVNDKPIISYIEETNLPDLHASFHPSGFKHIRVDKGDILVRFNAKEFDVTNFFEGLVRIFPKNPTKYPFVSIATKDDFLIPIESWVDHPMSLVFHVMSYAKEALSVKAPHGTKGFVIAMGKFNLVCTVMPMSIEDTFISEWPSETLWATPY